MRALALITIAALLVAVVVLGRAVVRLENYHYANQIGMCDKHEEYLAREACLNNTETRTHWFWHILYGTGVLPLAKHSRQAAEVLKDEGGFCFRWPRTTDLVRTNHRRKAAAPAQ